MPVAVVLLRSVLVRHGRTSKLTHELLLLLVSLLTSTHPTPLFPTQHPGALTYTLGLQNEQRNQQQLAANLRRRLCSGETSTYLHCSFRTIVDYMCCQKKIFAGGTPFTVRPPRLNSWLRHCKQVICSSTSEAYALSVESLLLPSVWFMDPNSSWSWW